MATATQDDRIAELVLQRQLMSQAQVDECRAIQGRSPTPVTLAQVIVAKRYVSADDLRQLAQASAAAPRASGAFPPAAGPRGSGAFPPAAGPRGSGAFPPAAGPRASGAFPPAASGPFASGAGPRASAIGAPVQPTPAQGVPTGAPGEDPELAFGRYLVAQNILTGDQAREGYKLLQGYRAQHPQVNLSQVLAKHGLCDKDRLRAAFQQFSAQKPSTPANGAPRPDPRASAGSNPFFPEAKAPPAPAAGGERFGYKTVELDPQERPDYDPRAAAPGTGSFPAPGTGSFPAGGGFAGVAPPAQGLDAFLPSDSAAIPAQGGNGGGPGGGPNGGWIESETLIERPGARGTGAHAQAPAQGPGDTWGQDPFQKPAQGPRGTHAGPAAAPPGHQGPGDTWGQDPFNQQAQGPRGTHAGPRGTAAGPRGTHGGPIRDDAAAMGLAPFGSAPGAPLPGFASGPAPFGSGSAPGAFGSTPGAAAFGSTPGAAAFGSAPGAAFGTAAGTGVQLPAPARPKLDLADDEEEEDEDEAPAPVSEEPEDDEPVGKKKRGDTNVQSSTFGGNRPARRGAKAQAKAGPPVAALAGGAAALVLVLSIGSWVLVSRHRVAKAKAEFVSMANLALEKGKPPLEDALAQRDQLPDKLLDDAEVKGLLDKLKTAVDRAGARKKAREILAGLPRAKTPEERVAVCTSAIEADATFGEAYVARARARRALARARAIQGQDGKSLVREALTDLDEAIQQEPEAPLAYLVQGQLHLETGKTDPDSRMRAEASLKRVTEKDDAGALGAMAQGLLQQVQEQHKEAVESFSRAIQRDPKLIDAYLARGTSRIRLRDWANALNDANEATRLDAQSSDALTLQAEARYFSSSDRLGALATLDKALKMDPTNPHALALRSYVRLERDRIGDLASVPEDREASKKDAQQALTVAQDEPLAYVTLAELAAAGNESSEAIRQASKAVECGKWLALTFLLRGRLRGKEGDENAIQDFEEVLRAEPNNAQALTNRAAMLVASKKDAELAQQLLDQAIQADSEIPWAYFWRGQIAMNKRQANHFKTAISEFSEAIARAPQFPDAYYKRALCYHEVGNFAEALKDLKKAEEQRIGGGNSASRGNFPVHEIYYARGMCHYWLREWKEAEEAFNKYRDTVPPGARTMPKVMRKLEDIRSRMNGQNADAPLEPKESLGDGSGEKGGAEKGGPEKGGR